jgi:pentatricopeptide repeat protein
MLNAVKNIAVDAISLVWLELLMFGLAVVTYLIFTGGYVKGSDKKTKKNLDSATTHDSPSSASASRSVRVRAALPPVSERKEKEEVDVSKHVAMMRARSREQDLEGAMQVFRKLQSSGVQLTALVYNALLDSCVQCGKVNIALQHFNEMKELGFVDVVSYNTLLKAYLKIGQIHKARTLLAEMAASNIQANQVTYNEMLNAIVTTKDRKEMWALVREMNAIGMKPNSVTCSIILKSLTAHSATDDVRQAMALIDNLQEDMDEVLFASVVEACVRVGQLDLLSSKLQQYASVGGLAGLTAPTYGSMIKAYGRARRP